MADTLSALDEEAALEELHNRGCTDGLPVVIPTAERVSRMVLASGLEGDMMLGTMGPGHGIATVEKVAIAAVMAGCKPDYMPVVLFGFQKKLKHLQELKTYMRLLMH